MSKGPYIGMFRHAAGPWIGLLSAWAVIAVGGLFWLAGGLASWFMGYGLTGPEFGFESARLLFTEGPDVLWPDVPFGLVVGIFLLLLAALALPVLIIVTSASRGPKPDDGANARLAIEKDLEHLTPDGVQRRAVDLGHELDGRGRRALAQSGVPLGILEATGTELRASWEDVAVAIMAPRSGKTTAEAIPAILEAPGAAVVTSNKVDVWAATAEVRRHDTGERSWLFDPQNITHTIKWEEIPDPAGGTDPSQRKRLINPPWWWNPLKDVTSYEAALRLATHFTQEIKQEDATSGSDDAYWISAAGDLLTGLLLAAGLNEGSLLDVYRWLSDPGDPEPIGILEARGDQATASMLSARQTGADETREGVYEYARTACRCLRNSEIMRWVVRPGLPLSGLPQETAGTASADPDPHRPEFVADGFARTRQTMYLLSKEGAAAAAPLVAALTDRIMLEATREAERNVRGRLATPMVVILDEAANICRIADLPALYSHLGSRGVFVLTILQSRPQARRVWGKEGFDTMWGAATIKIIGAGIDDPELTNDISILVGEHDTSIRSLSVAAGAVSESTSLRKESIMSPSAVRAMPKGTAILLATGAVPARIRLQPWYEGRRAAEIRAAVLKAEQAMTGHATMPEGEGFVPANRGARQLATVGAPAPGAAPDPYPADRVDQPAPSLPPPPAVERGQVVPGGPDRARGTVISQDGDVLFDHDSTAQMAAPGHRGRAPRKTLGRGPKPPRPKR